MTWRSRSCGRGRGGTIRAPEPIGPGGPLNIGAVTVRGGGGVGLLGGGGGGRGGGGVVNRLGGGRGDGVIALRRDGGEGERQGEGEGEGEGDGEREHRADLHQQPREGRQHLERQEEDLDRHFLTMA